MKNEILPNLSEKELLILKMIANGESLQGLQMVEQSDKALKRGTIYTTLQRMEVKGYVESFEEFGDNSETGAYRRKYKITKLGENLLKAYLLAVRFLNMNMGWESE